MDYKEDLRVVRTRKLLCSTLMDMMEEESLEKISVIDLCNKAMVNRATFYAHFEDKYHLLSIALEELKDEIYASFSSDIVVSCPKEMFRKLAHMALEFVTSKKNHVANILCYNRNEKVISTIKDSLTSSVRYQIGKFKGSFPEKVPISLVSMCFSSALVDISIWYIDNPDKYSLAEFTTYIDEMINEIGFGSY